MRSKINIFLKDLQRLVKGMNFYRALLLLLAVTIPIGIGALLGHVEMGLAVGFGAFWCSPSDISGSRKHMRNGILFSALLVTIVTFISSLIPDDIRIIIPSIGIMMFLISSISVFGFRGSLISFSGLLAFVLSFAFTNDSISIVLHSLLIGSGGLWYLILASIWYRLHPTGPIEEALNTVLKVTSKYIETRSKLVYPDVERNQLQEELFQYQNELGEQHETLREILLSERRSFGKSSYKRKRVLVFVQLINILEQAMANPVDYEKMDKLFREHKEPIEAFQRLLEGMCEKLNLLASYKGRKSEKATDIQLQTLLKNVELSIEKYMLRKDSNAEGVFILQNFYKYQLKQVESIEQISWIIHGGSIRDMSSLSASTAVKFITPQEYRFQILLDNFSFQSVIFRHALRLAMVSMFSFIIGNYLEVHNPYWILLTVIVILRPNYGLTKTRAKERTIGTIFGAIVALAIVFLVHNVVVYAILAVVSMLLAFSMIQENYRAGAAFITLNIIFVYALLVPDLWSVIQYRVIDTVIGAALATLGNILLWPAWEVKNIQNVIASSIRDNCRFLYEIVQLYERKGGRPTSYNLARKEAFLSVSNLSATFQRMTQEPKSQQQHQSEIYQLVSLNHTFLSALASPSTFIQNLPTTEASESFSLAAKNITDHLQECIEWLSGNENVQQFQQKELSYFLEDVDTTQMLSLDLNAREAYTIEMTSDINEAYLIIEQLKWLYSLSDQMLRLVKKIKSSAD